MHPPRHRRPHLSRPRHPAGFRDHPSLASANARHRHFLGLAPLRLHLGFPEFQLLLGNPLPSAVNLTVVPRFDLGAPPAVLLPGPSGPPGSLSGPARDLPWRVDWQTDVGAGGPLNRVGRAAASADVAVSLVYEFDAASFGACRRDDAGHEYCFADFLHEPSGTVSVTTADPDGRATAWAASAGIEILNFHVLRDPRNQDRLELGLPVGIAYQVDPSGASVTGQAGVSAEYHVNETVSVVVAGNVTFTPDDHGVAVDAGGTATLLIHGR